LTGGLTEYLLEKRWLWDGSESQNVTNAWMWSSKP
jgi:hypothetical protein